MAFATETVAEAGLPTGYWIREASWDDLPAIVSVLSSDVLGRTREGGADDPKARAAYEAAFDAVSTDPHHLLAVVTRGGCVVGTAQLSFLPGLSHTGGWRAQVESVHISSSERGKGLGASLMRWAIIVARTRGCHLVQLTSNKTRADAYRFYERLGFQPTHTGFKLALGPAVRR